jgi:predicted RND superfamily exporter protein
MVSTYTTSWSIIARGHQLMAANYRMLNTTGRAVSFTGFTLSMGVATWDFSPIRFQTDMDILLTFMFLWNMVGAMVLLPALAGFLLKEKSTVMPTECRMKRCHHLSPTESH